MRIARKLLVVVGVLLLIPIVAIGTLLVRSGSSDGPGAVFERYSWWLA